MTSGIPEAAVIDWGVLSAARIELGANFVRILGYFREDGEKSVAAIEAAMRSGSAAAMVIPAHTLKGESAQFGAELLTARAEAIETIARDCVETHDSPQEALEHVASLRGLFEQTLTLLERETSPLVERRPAGGFGRRAV
ncbi:Hpt domain-containing protein [Sphingomonas sp. Leaf33]|uniref:Hpt domain-containing protein n=1 Tax=Sphingomonas sp. Leaf33 TaxID=1736215 RepID=UPI000A73F7B3|nr:Hpt domain-containing protein [Sphingomonas sp. Leaf33]